MQQIHPDTDTSLFPFSVSIREVRLYMIGACKAKAWCKHPHKWMKNSNLPIKINILEKLIALPSLWTKFQNFNQSQTGAWDSEFFSY